MVKLRIGENNVELRPLQVQGIKLDKDDTGKKDLYVNKVGQPLKRIQVTKGQYKYVNEKTLEEESKAFKSYNGKPVASFSRTSEVDAYDTCDITEMQFYIENEKTYLVSCDKAFRNQLDTMAVAGKAMTFKYANSGFKMHRAFVYYDANFDRVFMRLMRGDLRKADLSEQNVGDIETDEGVGQLDAMEVDV